MCGIFGIYSKGGAPISLRAVLSSTTILRHRGPDDEGYLLANTKTGGITLCAGLDTDPSLHQPMIETQAGEQFDLAFGFRRLSILDVSSAGHQPMASGDKTCWLIFNGEIYNYLELREELIDRKRQFQTGTDTEVVLAAYQQWGVNCLKHFTGMWAFALLDTVENKLFLARDRFGIKPLYYVNDDSRFCFASEIKALLETGTVNKRVNSLRLYDYLSYGITDYGNETLFESIKQLPAAHYMTVPLDRTGPPQLERYWEIDLDQRSKLSFEDAALQLQELFLDSVKLHLRSDVPVGTALSGGIDSSSIVMAMRQVGGRLDLHTFSYTADDARLDEERWVDIVVAEAGSTSHKVKPTPAELVSDLDQLISIQDEPFGSTSIYAQNRVFRLAKNAGIKVMLDGQGADEILAGYPYYLISRIASLLSGGQWFQARRLLKRASSLYDTGELKLAISAGGLLVPQNVRRLAKGFLKNGEAGWINEKWFQEQGVTFNRQLKTRGHDFLRGELRDSMVESSLPMLLRYEDRNSMAHSIESRVPFLTHQLAEFIFSLPESYLIGPDGLSKSVFRKAMQSIVPKAILARRDKIGFATPENNWLTALQPWVDGVLNGSTAEEIPALDHAAIRSNWDKLKSNGQPFNFTVWRWLNVIRWVQTVGVSF